MNLDELTKSLDKTRRDRAHQRLPLLRHARRSTGSTRSATTCAPASWRTCAPTPCASSGGAQCNANFYESGTRSRVGGHASRRATRPSPKQGPHSGSVRATGTLLQDLLGTGETPQQAREREELAAERCASGRTSRRAALGRGEPMLDYLLGGDGR